MPKIDKLTPEQEAMLPVFRDFGLRIGLSTERTNRPAAEVAIKAHYVACGLAAPEVRWFDSPFASVRDSVGASVRASVENSVWASVWASVRDSVRASVRASVRDSVRASVRANVRDSVGNSVWVNVGTSVGTSVLANVRDSVGNSVWVNVGNSVRASVENSVWASVWASVGAHYDADFAAWIMALHAYDLSLDPRALTYAAVTEHMWWWYPGKNIVFASDRPTAINLDESGRLHCENGMAVRFADGTGVSAWHGTTVPDQWLADRENLDPNEVIRARNVEQRAAGAAIVGWPKMLSVLQCRVIDADPDPSHGELIELALPGLPEPGRFLKAECPRNGTICEGVPRDIMTVHEAQAWRLGLSVEEFRYPLART